MAGSLAGSFTVCQYGSAGICCDKEMLRFLAKEEAGI
jgi:hypothetical protein